jgi:predicted nucleic acid-binding protein
MSGFVFFDSNILVYTEDASEPEKQRKASDLLSRHLRDGTGTVSLQVLQEYFSITTRKLKVPADEAQRNVEIFAQFRVVRFEVSDVIAAIEIHRLRRLSFWDSLIVHAAKISGAKILYSEDLVSGSEIGGLRIVNPFAA